MAARLGTGAPGLYRPWARFGALLLAFALACDVAAALVGVPDRGKGGVRLVLIVVGLLVGSWAAGVACIARAHWALGDGNVTSGRRFALGCLLSLGLVAALCFAWVLWPFWVVALQNVPESLWMWFLVGPPLVLAAERLGGPILSPRQGDHSSRSRAKSTS